MGIYAIPRYLIVFKKTYKQAIMKAVTLTAFSGLFKLYYYKRIFISFFFLNLFEGFVGGVYGASVYSVANIRGKKTGPLNHAIGSMIAFPLFTILNKSMLYLFLYICLVIKLSSFFFKTIDFK